MSTNDNNVLRVIEKPFKARARLLPQLGDMLIKSEDVAFLELIKNSYDADADQVTILLNKVLIPEEGTIIIEDDGIGMNLDIITNVWLELASDYKTKKVNNSELTPKGRLPIGEKGIGRLGAHKLGNRIKLISKRENDHEVHVDIDWRVFDQGDYLDNIPIKVYEKIQPEYFINKKSGTYLAISDLTKKTKWGRGKFREIQRVITSFTNPFEETSESFKPSFSILDHPEWLEEIITWEDIKDYAIINFEIELQDQEITKFYYNYHPFNVFNKVSPRVVKHGNFDEKNEKDAISKIVTFSDDIVKSNKTILSESRKSEPVDISGLGIINIRGYIFNLEAFAIKDTVSDKKGLKKYLKENSGIKVYRGSEPANGRKTTYARIYNYGEPGNDWLGLNLKRVNFPSSISNNIIIAGVFLDREKTKILKEKTDRQGFIEDETFFKFRNAVLHAISVLDIFRRADMRILRDQYGPKGGEEPVISSLNKLRDLINDKINDQKLRLAINKYIDDIELNYSNIQSNLLKTAGAGLSLGIVLHEVEKIIKELLHIIRSSEDNQISDLVKRLYKLVNGYAELFKSSSRTNIQLRKVIEDALFSVEYRLRAHDIKIIKSYENSEVSAKIAKGLIEGVLINLIDNSIYWLDIAKREYKKIINKEIFIDIVELEDEIHIILADNGTGFLLPTDVITEPFITGKKSGMGLGLHIANEIMLSDKGRIEFPDFFDYEIQIEFKGGALLSLIFNK